MGLGTAEIGDRLVLLALRADRGLDAFDAATGKPVARLTMLLAYRR